MTDLPRRALLRGSAIAALTMAATSSSSRTREQQAPQPGTIDGPLIIAADRATLAAIASPTVGQIVYLDEGAREGFFKCRAGKAPEADRLQGLFVASNNRDLHYERVWDGTNGRPEWFGALPNDGNADCAEAIEACYARCAVTKLSQADYYIRRTLHLSQSYRTLRGSGNWSDAQGQGTRIILHHDAPGLHSDDVVILGSVDAPLVPSDQYPRENFIGHFTIVRDGPCTPHPSGELLHYPTGLRISYVFRCSVDHVTSMESSVGIYLGGTVYTKIDDCCARRERPGTVARNDFSVGYLVDGSVAFSGYPGGNASLYLNRCLAVEQHPQHVDPIGLLARGAFVDLFVDNFESARMATGIVLAVKGARGYSQTMDTHIRNPIIDGVTKYGINIDLDGTASTSIEIIDPYVAAVAGPGAINGITIHDGGGLVTITGGQLLNNFREGGLHFARTFGSKVQGIKIHQSSKPVVIDDAGGLAIEPQISNYNKTSPNFAISATKLVRSIVRPTINGWQAPAFAGGVSLDATSHHVAVDGSAIDPDWFSTPDPRFKVWYKGGDARGGATGAAFAAAGNRLVGVID